MKYSLFIIESRVLTDLVKQEVIYVDTFDTLEEAKEAQKKIIEKTIILTSC